MTSNIDPTASNEPESADDELAENAEPKQSAETVPDGSGNNTSADKTEDDSASGGPA